MGDRSDVTSRKKGEKGKCVVRQASEVRQQLMGVNEIRIVKLISNIYSQNLRRHQLRFLWNESFLYSTIVQFAHKEKQTQILKNEVWECILSFLLFEEENSWKSFELEDESESEAEQDTHSL